MYFREKVEYIVIKRLCSKTKDKKVVSDEEFNHLKGQLDPVMHQLANERRIEGFSQEDLYSFLLLKLHQLLRRNQYDGRPKFHRYFYRVFTHFLNDVERLKNRYSKIYDRDALDDWVKFRWWQE